MDKYEYKIKSEEIKSLIKQGQYQQAMEIADEIDWRRVKSVMMLCTISDLYKINRRLEDSRDLLLLAYDRHPGGRTIVFSLCELSVKMGDIYQAVEYYKEFVQIAPNDTGRYILQYKLYEAQEVGLEERIAVLESMKKEDYREKWAFELARLYHKAGMAVECVEECDELILWFGEGKYVDKAMDLKMLHQPLTPDQQAKYDARFAAVQVEEETVKEEVAEEETSQEPVIVEESVVQEQTSVEDEIHVKTMDVGEYNTINLQKELAEGLKEVLNEPQNARDAITQSIIAPMLQETVQMPAEEVEAVLAEPQASEPEVPAVESEVFFSETGEMEVNAVEEIQWQADEEPSLREEVMQEDAVVAETAEQEPVAETSIEGDTISEEVTALEEEIQEPVEETDTTAQTVMEDMRRARQAVVEPPKNLAGVLSMESDGQLSLVMPKEEAVEKQITGQMSIEDILAEWERMKNENKEKREAEVRQRVLQRTGAMFTEFEAKMRDSLLEQLEGKKSTPPAVMKLTDVESEETADESGEEVIQEDVLEDESVAEIVEDAEIEEEMTEEELAQEPEYAAIVEEISEEAEIEEALEEVLSEEESDGSDGEVEELEEIQEETDAEEVAEFEEVRDAEEVTDTREVLDVEEVAETQVDAMESSSEETDRSEDDAAEGISFESAEEEQPEQVPVAEEAAPVKSGVRTLTREEKALFAPYIQGKSSREQLIKVLDGISMAAYTGNVIVTAPEGVNTLGLAKNIVRDVQATDDNFSGKTAKISGKSLENQDITKLTADFANGALIIQKATDMTDESAESLYKALQQENLGILVILEDTKKAMNKFLEKHQKFLNCFTARMDIDALSDEALVAFARKYAKEMEYSIDEFGILALHQRIDEMQTSDHVVTVLEVKEMVDEAIRHANRKNLGHFFDILLGKRYDEEDMIILREKDFA